MKRTIFDLMIRASSAIERQEELVFEVAAINGQSFHNVAHMRWFKLEVMKRLCYTFKCWEHLTDETEKMSYFDL